MGKSILVIPIILFYLFVAPAKAQINSQIFPSGSVSPLENQAIDIRNIPNYKVPRINTDELLIEDLEEKVSGRPFRFGKAIDVNIDFFKLSVKEVRQDTVIHYYSITSSDAHSLNLIFDNFYLSENASLKIYSMDGSMIYGPVKHDHNPENSVFWTDLIKGDGIIIEVKIIGKDSGESAINIEKVVHGYINTFSGFDQSAPCNRDIACPEGSQWRQDGNSVAMLLLDSGQRFCSGVLLNNTCNDFTNNFLTAFHCLDTNQNGELTEIERNQVNNWVFRFMYESPSCNGIDGISFQ
ncbi:hypothetical protein MM213_12640 [Belliella sp. R4-6]|uniref:Lysyl endopeptidase n=1 Tax=Belliella alkalica TaxID=1730871 RepID=A0ABS9VEN2_9BACT|nr:hypothetical protein [Belliella alkalica]MCH7414338.1 hypothetical protein [Belliella alkalica]